MKKKQYKPKFAFNYKILGFYNFYKNLSNYISKNITLKYFHNGNKLRKLLKGDIKEEEKKFHENEEILLNNVNDEVRKNKFVIDTINIIQKPLFLEDYITYYLNKYNNNINTKNDSYYKLIELLIKLRFKEKHEISKNNLKNENYTLLAIIWLESNINYIFSVLKVCDYAQQIFNIFNYDKKKLYTTIEKIIDDKKIRYVTNDLKNPEYTKEVNECYYIFLASLCLCITSSEIKLKDKNDITNYCSILKKINKILENLNNDLCIFLNEMYIIDELIKVIEVVEKNEKINIEDIKIIKNYFRENAFILQKDQLDKIDELKLIFNKTYDLINYKSDKKIISKEDKDYYDLLRYIFYKEIKKVSDINYRCIIFEKLIDENEIIKKSSNIFQILLEEYIEKKNIDYIQNLIKIINKGDEIIILIEKYLDDDAKDHFALSETLLYFFEKNSLVYLNNYLNNFFNEKKEQPSLWKEPLNAFKKMYRIFRRL